MPTYDYSCKSCDTVFEAVAKISDRDNVSSMECPSCGSKDIVRGLSAPMVAYSVRVAGGYGRISDGFRDVLRKIQNAPGANKNNSSFL
jgi:putative FmdB family regulatory protein